MVLKKTTTLLILIVVTVSLILVYFNKEKIITNTLITNSTSDINQVTEQKRPIKINTNECQNIKNIFYYPSNEVKNKTQLSFENIHVDNHGIIYRLRKFHKSGIQKYYQFNVYRENANEEASLIEKNVGSEGTLYNKIKNENYPIIFSEQGYNHQELFLFYQNGNLKLAEGKYNNQNIRCDLF
jgi:hypothetical protein